jgi:hypothetical protein
MIWQQSPQGERVRRPKVGMHDVLHVQKTIPLILLEMTKKIGVE